MRLVKCVVFMSLRLLDYCLDKKTRKYSNYLGNKIFFYGKIQKKRLKLLTSMTGCKNFGLNDKIVLRCALKANLVHCDHGQKILLGIGLRCISVDIFLIVLARMLL